jgi:hypothetical protein
MILEDLLKNLKELKPANLDENETISIMDSLGRHFQLITLGWEGKRFVYHVMFHFEIKDDGKIWIQQNSTDMLIADRLMEMGILREDIVLGFQPPFMRAESGFAVA